MLFRSFKSQSTDLEVGENIEFKFKHLQDSSDVFYVGKIVWKQKDNIFNCVMGVKFKEIDKEAKIKMLEIVSVAGNIPVDSFLSDKGDKDIHVDEPETTRRVEEVEEAHDETLELDMEEVDDTVLQMDSGQAIYDDTSPIEKDLRKKIWLYLSIAIAIVITLFVIFEKSNKILKSPVPVSTKSVFHEDIDKKHSSPIVVDAQTRNIEYYIQVGAWKHPKYAQEMLVKLKRYYPKAYITVENNFHKVRIPEIMNKRQGANISRIIEVKFNMKPIVVRNIK